MSYVPVDDDLFVDTLAYQRYLDALKEGRRLNRRNVGRLTDNDGNRFPSPTTPFIYRGGNGRNDDPPVGAASYSYDRRKAVMTALLR